MGVTPSVQLNVPQSFSHFSLTFGHTDRLRLIMAPQEIKNATDDALLKFWPLQDKNEQPGFIEYKLKGTPFSPNQELDKNVKYLICILLKEYYSLGWHFRVSSDLQRLGSSSDVLIFERLPPLSTFVICLSLNSSDKIRVFAPEEVISSVRNAIIAIWSLGIQKEERFNNGYEFKLKGNPWGGWSADNDETYISANLINYILQVLYNQGWSFIGAIKSGGRQQDLNALYFRFDPELQERNKLQEPSRFFALSLNRNDRIRLINAPNDLANAIKTAIMQAWPKGVQEEMIIGTTYEIKIKGNPWWCDAEETVYSRQLVSNIFKLLRQYSWNFYATCELSYHLNSKGVFFFRYDSTTNINLRPLCISLNESDKIRVIDANQNHVNAVVDAIAVAWPKGMQDQSLYAGASQFKLRGNPFSGSSSNLIYASAVMMYIFANLKSQGAIFQCSASVSGKYHQDKHGSYPIDLSSWFFLF